MVKLRAERPAAANGRLIPGALTGSPGGGPGGAGGQQVIHFLSIFLDWENWEILMERSQRSASEKTLMSNIFHIFILDLQPSSKRSQKLLPGPRNLLVHLFSPLFAAQTDSGCGGGVVKHLGEVSAQLFVTSRRADFPEAGVLVCGRVEFSG